LRSAADGFQSYGSFDTVVRHAVGWGWVVVGLGCGPAVDQDGSTADSSSSGPASTSSPGTSEPATAATSIADTTIADAETSEAGDLPVPPPDLVPDGCDLFAQDCPAGFKCMPYSNDGGAVWNDLRCTPIARDPQVAGASCTAEDPLSGVDDCELGSMCWDVDLDTHVGFCIDFCRGSEADPSCDGACESCHVYNSAPLALCVPDCDPIAQDCAEGQACYPIDDRFACSPDAAGSAGGIGEPCEFLNDCRGGSFCAGAERVPGCEGTGCCTPYCDVDLADVCDAMIAGTVCMPWYEPGRGPDGCATGTLGACALPGG
jgi:hypothetical protein